MNTTISISKKTRDLLKNYGKKSENYDDIIKRMHSELLIREEVREYMDETRFISLEDAKEWTELKIKNER
ncbi:MAG: hypothetical protein ACMXX9_03950 [Candidatus Woesearchaeota archaeon]